MENEHQEATAKRSVHRSPKYPGLTFSEALERARVIYERDRRTPAKAETVLGHIGIRPGSGTANRILSALKQYGLLDEQELGKLRVSDSAYRILELSEGSPEREGLIRDAALRPSIIQEVLAKFPDGLPSDATLGDFLKFEKNFNPDAVSFFVRVLRDNLAFVGPGIGARDTSIAAPRRDELVDEPRGYAHVSSGLPSRTPDVGPDLSDPYNYPLSRDCLGIVRFRGQPTQADIQRLIDFLNLSKLAFPESNDADQGE